MVVEKFNLLWHGHNDNFAACVKDALSQLEFTDVTLVSDDDKQIRAHKFILSSCSPVLRQILLNNPHNNPLLFLMDINHKELQSIINFMYMGEVEVAQDNLENFLNVGAKLQIKGLAVNENVSVTDKINQPRTQSEPIEEEKAKSSNEENQIVYHDNMDDKEENTTEVNVKLNQQGDLSRISNWTIESGKYLADNGTYNCDKCYYKTSDNSNFRRHVLTIHSSIMLSCPYCEFQCKRSDNLKTHTNKKHGKF